MVRLGCLGGLAVAGVIALAIYGLASAIDWIVR